MSNVIVKRFGSVDVAGREGDGYINATALCQAAGKRWNDYSALDAARFYAAALSVKSGRPITSPAGNIPPLIEARVGRGGGTWVHPQIAIHCAMWCSAAFAVQVTEWVFELMTKGRVELQSSVPPPEPLAAYTRRILLAGRMEGELAPGFWCVFIECSSLLLKIERAFPGRIGPKDLADGSIGTLWADSPYCAPFIDERRRYIHRFPDGDSRHNQLAWQHPDAALPPFRAWMRHDYVPTRLGDYLCRKYGGEALNAALPSLRTQGLAIETPARLVRAVPTSN